MSRGAVARGACAQLVLAAGVLTAAVPARGIEFFEGRVQVHGSTEMQIRGLASHYNSDDGWDLTQWYNIANLELELDVAPNGFGPFDSISAYVRGEARYDCIWKRGCGMFHSVDLVGNDARRLPRRMSSARRDGFIGVIEPEGYADERPRIAIPLGQNGSVYGPGGLDLPVTGRRTLGRLWNVPGIGELFFAGRGPDLVYATADDPGLYVMQDFLDYRFGLRRTRGAVGGNGTQVLGPYRPKDKVPEEGALRDRANPLRAGDIQPVLGLAGQGELPFRVAPLYAFDDASAPRGAARGLFYPSAAFAALIEADRFGIPDQNFSESALAWNHGASQQDTRELKEAYVDLELLESRLWVRLGLQTTVWGKTELFRAQDQFNPQDLALSSLPSLEESRVALWGGRFTYSFYDVGPLEDVRAEVAFNFDDFEPADIGRCGEPYAPRASCDKSFGMLGHSLTGLGIAGEVRPPDPWDSIEGVEVGARVEWRWERFTFSLSDFYGYDDLPYTQPVSVFERNVDPFTGRPRRYGSRAGCDPNDDFGRGTQGCLGVSPLETSNPAQVEDVLRNHHANQQLFTTICAATLSQSNLLPQGCGFNVWNSIAIADPSNGASPRLSMAFSAMLAGQGRENNPNPGPFAALSGKIILFQLGRFATMAGGLSSIAPPVLTFRDEDDMPLVPLVVDPGDSLAPAVEDAYFAQRVLARGGAVPDPLWNIWRSVGVARRLNDEQEALIGCGRFWGTQCDVDGFDLFNAEASVLFQSWPGFEGTGGTGWLTTDNTRAQPGTLGFVEGGPVCTRREKKTSFILPGCRAGTAPSVAQNNPAVTPRANGAPGAATPAFLPGHPFTGQVWDSELAALSWNLLMMFVALSTPDDANGDGISDVDPQFPGGRFDEFDPRDPYSTTTCSFANPILCKNVSSLLALTGTTKNTVKAGGNERFGRRDFQWHGGSSVALHYDKRNVLGFSADFAEDLTRTSWGVEFSWFEGVPVTDLDAFDALERVDPLNLVISVDRPTFINFLNRNRTFFFNTQVFFQYLVGYNDHLATNGPFNTRATFTVSTGYYQDRMLPSLTWVHDFPSQSGGVLPSLTWRFSESYSVTVGANVFYGRVQQQEAALVPRGGLAGGAGKGAYHTYTEEGLATLRERDEIYLRLRATF